MLIYVAAVLLVLRIHRYSPTNLAGPGLDIVVFFVCLVFAIGILAGNLVKTTKAGATRGLRFVNLLGSLAILLLTIYSLMQS